MGSPQRGSRDHTNGVAPTPRQTILKGSADGLYQGVGVGGGHVSNSNSSSSANTGTKQRRGRQGVCGVLWFCVLCIADTVRWIPVIFISAVVLWSYYAYTVELCFYAIHNMLQRVLYLVCYHIVFVMFVWSYSFTIFYNPGAPQKRFTLSLQQLDHYTNAANEQEERIVLQNIAHTLPVLCRQHNGGVRYCKPCTAIKPDRCHHCSICRRCVLKMDHHCPWVNNCIGFGNYKFFVLFLLYATLYCFYVSVSDMPYFISYWKLNEHKELSLSHRMQVIFLGLVASMFIIGVLSLLSYHIFLLFNNKTTIETFRLPIFVTGEDKRGFGIGWRKNFIQVFGSDPKLWPFPVFSSLGNGNSFPCAQQEPESNNLLGEEFEEAMEGCVVHSGTLGCDIISAQFDKDDYVTSTDSNSVGVNVQDYSTNFQGVAVEHSEKSNEKLAPRDTIELFSVSEEEDNDYTTSKLKDFPRNEQLPVEERKMVLIERRGRFYYAFKKGTDCGGSRYPKTTRDCLICSNGLGTATSSVPSPKFVSD